MRVNSAAALIVGSQALLYSASAHAYLDPGSGSMILQGLIAALAIAGSGISMFWGRIKSIFTRSKATGDETPPPAPEVDSESKDR